MNRFASMIVIAATAASLTACGPVAGAETVPTISLPSVSDGQKLSADESYMEAKDAEQALRNLDRLTVDKTAWHGKYDREGQFGNGHTIWVDVDGNHCDTRNDILARDLSHTVGSTDGCTVYSGTLNTDPYTGKKINFVRGRKTSAQVQIDHIVAPRYAIQGGADTWTHELRVDFANDPLNLIAVDGPANERKGWKGPSDWLVPDNENFRCSWIQRWVNVMDKYDVQVQQDDLDAAHQELMQCVR